MKVRPALLSDTAAAGALVCDALPHAASSEFQRVDFPSDEIEIGREVLAAPLAAKELVWVLETGAELAGLAVARARPLARSSHVSDLRLLVHPIARGRGGGQMLLTAICRAATEDVSVHKLVMRVAADDLLLKRTLIASALGWRAERTEIAGLTRGAQVVDTELWGLIVSQGPCPEGFQGR